MDLQKFDVLEKKVSQLISLIDKLKTENGDLRRRLQEAEALQKQTDEQLRQARESIDKIRGNQDEANSFKEREEKIKSKVEQMLAKLEELQLQS
jgi:exonuclease VII small subunit